MITSLRARFCERSNLIVSLKDCFAYAVTSFLAITISIFLFSCGNEKEKTIPIPADILPKEKMAMVITDIHLAEAEANLKLSPDTSSEKLNFQSIFEKNKIAKDQYKKSIAFYIDHPELLNEVYENVLNELSRMQGEAAKSK